MTLSLGHCVRSLMICCNLSVSLLRHYQTGNFSVTNASSGNGKVDVTLQHLNDYFLDLDIVNNNNIKVKDIGQNGLYLKPKGKSRLALSFVHKIRGPWWSSEHLTLHKKCFLRIWSRLLKKSLMVNFNFCAV